MDLRSGCSYWTINNGLLATFPRLQRDTRCDVAVVGAGITGALIARSLCEAGLDVIVLDKRDAGWGSTAATTALLQYEIDGGMLDVARRYGEPQAAALFKACEQAIRDIEPIAREVRGSHFRRTSSLYFASWPWHSTRLEQESALRRRHGFEHTVLDRAALKAEFGIDASVALLTKVSARMDPYRVAVGVLRRLAERGCQVFDRTGVLNWENVPGGLRLTTDRDATVRCKHVVLAAGYETQEFLPERVAVNHSTYAMITEPVENLPPWLERTLVWESRRPYIYLRATEQGRLLIGGEDDLIDLPGKRDRAVQRKSRKLLAKLRKLVGRDDIEKGFAWAGTFAETDDALPFFGCHDRYGPRVHFAMAYGGNGIVYAVIGAEVIRRQICRQSHPLTRFLSFERRS